MSEDAKTHCLFCSLCCPVNLCSALGERFWVEYETPEAPGVTQGLCGRGNALVDLEAQPNRLSGGVKQTAAGMTRLGATEAIDAFAEIMDEAMSRGPVALLADGNLPCEDLLAIRRWAEAQDGRVTLAVSLPPPDMDLLDGLSASGAPLLNLDDLASCDAVLIVGNAFATHPVLARRLLDKKFDSPRQPLAVMDARRSVTSRFATTLLEVAPDGQEKALEQLRAALDVSISLEPSPAIEKLAGLTKAPKAAVERLVKQLQSARRLAVVITPELTLSADWRGVAGAADKLARKKNGGILPLFCYGNAVGAYRILRNLGLKRVEQLLKPSGGERWSAFVQVGCDIGRTFPEPLLKSVRGDATRQVLFSPVRTPAVERSDLAVGILMPAEYSGTILDGCGLEKRLDGSRLRSNAALGIREFFLTLLGEGFAEEDAAAWRTQPEAAEAPVARMGVPGNSDLNLLATVSPIHFDDGALTRRTSWTAYWESEPRVCVSEAVARGLGIRSGERVHLARNGRSLNCLCKIDPSLEDRLAIVSGAFPEVRRFLAWEWDRSGRRILCPPAGVTVKATQGAKE